MKYLILIFTRIYYFEFSRMIRNPEKTQDLLWNRIKRSLARTEFWTFRMKNISKCLLSDFSITTYDDYSEIIKTSLSKTNSLLNGEKIIFIAQTSGTTGERKYFPYTKSFYRQSKKPTLTLLYSLFSRFYPMSTQPALYLAATDSGEKAPSRVEIGYVSHFQYKSIPRLLKRYYGFPLEVLENEDMYLKWAGLYALSTDLSSIFAVTPAKVVQLAELIIKNYEFYKPYLNGQKRLPNLLPNVSITDQRRALIEAVMSKEVFSFDELWPSLKFICCWTGASCSLQIDELKKFLNRIPIVETCYASTESVMTVPIYSGVSDGVFHPGSSILEFIPIDQPIKRENLIQAWQLEVNRDYEVFVTNSLGLVRYRQYDVIRCKGFVEKSPRLEFQFKSNNIITIGHTRISESQLVKVIKEINLKTDLNTLLFVPHSDGRGLELLYTNLSHEELKCIDLFDLCLSNTLVDYKDDLLSGLLKPLRHRKVMLEKFSHHQKHAQGKLQLLSVKSLDS